MLRIIIAAFILGMLILSSCESGVSGDELVLANQQDSLAYAHGASYHSGEGGLGSMGIFLNPDLYLEGFNAAKKAESVWSLDRAQRVLFGLTQELQTRQGRPFSDSDPMQSNIDSISMALGAYDSYTYIGCNFETNGEAICAGIREAQAEKQRLPEDMLSSLSQTFQMELNQAMVADREVKGEEAKLKGAQFLATNKDKDGIKVSESGLQYKVIENGNGAKPTLESTVVVHYEGKLIDGTVFDGSIGAEPLEIGVNQVIPGWTEGLQLMNIGSKYQFFIPSELGYGARGAGRDIGPHETLIFEVELLEIR